MNLTFINPGMDYMIHSIMEFQSDEETSFWTEPLYHFYPQLDKEQAQKLTFPERKKYIESIMKATYMDLEETKPRSKWHISNIGKRINSRLPTHFQRHLK